VTADFAGGDIRSDGGVLLRRQPVLAVALGYEDVNDHDRLRFDGALQTACGQVTVLGSSNTVGRMERRGEGAWAWKAE
jgi:hypothetical protein